MIETKLTTGEYYYVEALDHQLVVANEEEPTDKTYLQFIGKYTKTDDDLHYFNISEYKLGNDSYRSDELRIIVGTIRKLFFIPLPDMLSERDIDIIL